MCDNDCVAHKARVLCVTMSHGTRMKESCPSQRPYFARDIFCAKTLHKDLAFGGKLSVRSLCDTMTPVYVCRDSMTMAPSYVCHDSISARCVCGEFL